MHYRNSLSYIVNQLNLSLTRDIDECLKRYNMDSKSLPILCELWQEEGISQTELSHRCHMANYTVTRILDQLQEKSFITRHQELENRRVFQIFLTVTAKAMKQDVLYDIEKINNQYLSKLTQCNQQELINLLKLAQADCTDN